MFKEQLRKHRLIIIAVPVLAVICIALAVFLSGQKARNIKKLQSGTVSIVCGLDRKTGQLTDDVSVGSGFIFDYASPNKATDNTGTLFVLTANHNITSDNLLVRFNVDYTQFKDSWYTPEVVYSDPTFDVAILSFTVSEHDAIIKNVLKIAESSNVKEGDTVYCSCTPKTPFLQSTLLDGKITKTSVNGLANQYLIMTDLPLSPGCSGSPIMNGKGEIIGMNCFESTEFGTEGMSFAIYAERLNKIIDNYKNGVRPVDYGLEFEANFTGSDYAMFDYPGLIIKSISDTSYFKNTDLKVGDKIQSLNGNMLFTAADFYENLAPGTSITVTGENRSGAVNIEFNP